MKTVVISVAGGSGSGKTTVSNKIVKNFKKKDVRIIKLDDYYKRLDMPFSEREKVNYDHPDSLDFDLFVEQINDLVNGKSIEKPLYDYSIHQRKEETEYIEPSRILVLEGILVLQDERIRKLSDIKVYVDTDSDIRFIRRMTRDINERGRSVESVVTQYLTTVKPMHEAFVEKTKKYADIIIPNDFQHDVAVDLLESKISEILKK